MTCLFVTPPTTAQPLPTELVTRCHQFLSPEERHHLSQLSGKRHREFLLGRSLLRHALTLTLAPGHRPDLWLLRTRPQAAPALDSPEASGWHCSLSHSRSRVVVALTNRGRCGVDIEARRPRKNLQQMAATYFSHTEQAYLSGVSDQDWQDTFYRLWSQKEAWYKSGAAQDFNQVLTGLDFSQAASPELPATSPMIWHQSLAGFSLAFAGQHRPETLWQGWPGDRGVSRPPRLTRYRVQPVT